MSFYTPGAEQCHMGEEEGLKKGLKSATYYLNGPLPCPNKPLTLSKAFTGSLALRVFSLPKLPNFPKWYHLI